MLSKGFNKIFRRDSMMVKNSPGHASNLNLNNLGKGQQLNLRTATANNNNNVGRAAEAPSDFNSPMSRALRAIIGSTPKAASLSFCGS